MERNNRGVAVMGQNPNNPKIFGHVTLRDLFALAALVGVTGSTMPESGAKESYAYADAMLAERIKE